MDAVEAKKAAALITAIQQKAPATITGKDTDHTSNSNGKRRVVEDDRPAPVYASQSDATDAFKAMLLDKKVSVCTVLLLSIFSFLESSLNLTHFPLSFFAVWVDG